MEQQAHATLFLISDALGETAELVSRAAMSQFPDAKILVRRFRHIEEEDSLKEIFLEVKAASNPMILFTLIVPTLREFLLTWAEREKVRCVDVMGSTVHGLQEVLGVAPSLRPGLVHRLDEEYFRRIKAVDFAV